MRKTEPRAFEGVTCTLLEDLFSPAQRTARVTETAHIVPCRVLQDRSCYAGAHQRDLPRPSLQAGPIATLARDIPLRKTAHFSYSRVLQDAALRNNTRFS